MLAVQIVCFFLWGLTWPQQTFIELSFIVPQDEVRPWETVVAGFEAEHPDIQINIVTDPETTYTTDQREAIYTADFQAEVAQYDLVYMDIVWTPKFAEQLVDLMSLIERDSVDTSGFLSSELSAGRYEGGLYRLPMRADLGILYYRQDLLAEADLVMPLSLAEFAQVIETLQQFSDVDYGYLWQGRSYEGLVVNFFELMSSLGATWINPRTKEVGLDRPAAIQAGRLLKSFLQEGLSPPIVTDYTEQSSLAEFQRGQAVFLRGWPYFWSELSQAEWGGELAIALPFSFVEESGVGCRGGWGFGIPKNAAHPEAAWEAIKYFTSETAQEQFVLASGFLPSWRSLFEKQEIVAQYPMMPQMLDYLEKSSVFRPALKQYDAASEILQTALGKILRGQQSVEAALQQAQVETEALLNNGSEEF